VCQLYHDGVLEAVAYPQNPVFQAAVQFACIEGIVPAPEAAHAVKAAMDEALRCREEGRSRTILFNLSGHGYFDLSAYDSYLAGKLEDYAYPQAEIDRALAGLPRV
jgi:tryptophan synthase beta chain